MNIVIASMGRCGSQMLFDTLALQLKNHKALFTKYLNLEYFSRDNHLLKTHCFFYRNFMYYKNTKYIYLFGDPDIIAHSVSLQPDGWKKKHLENLGSEYTNDNETLFYSDEMKLAQNINSWLSYEQKALFIHYDVLFESKKKISNYLEFEVKLPERTQRATQNYQINECYIRLKKQINELPKIFING